MPRRARLLDMNDERSLAHLQRRVWDRSARDVGEEEIEDVIPVTDQELISSFPHSLTAGGSANTYGSNVSIFTATEEVTIVGLMLSKFSSSLIRRYFLRVQVTTTGGATVNRAEVGFSSDNNGYSQHFALPIALRINAGETVYMALACEQASATAEAGMFTYAGPL